MYTCMRKWGGVVAVWDDGTFDETQGPDVPGVGHSMKERSLAPSSMIVAMARGKSASFLTVNITLILPSDHAKRSCREREREK